MDDRSSDRYSSTSLKLSSLNHTSAAILLHSQPEENISDSPRRQSSWQTVLAELRGPQRLWTTTLGVVVASLSPLLGGYTLGFASPALLQLNHNHVPAEYHLEGAILGLFASLAPIGAMVGGAGAGLAVDFVGRKSALMFSAILNLIGWLTLAGANIWRNSVGFKALLLIGRFFTGTALGCGMLCAPVYIGEISPPALRGILGSFNQFAITIGILLVYLVGAIPGFSYEYIALTAVAIATVFVLLLAPPWIPMTPRYLLMKGRWEEALKELKWLRGPHVSVAEELEETKQVIVSIKRLSLKELYTELTKRKSIVAFVLTLFASVAQQLSGVNALIFFAGNMFSDCGFTNPQLVASISIAIVSTVTVLVSLILIDLLGRKILLIGSGMTMALSCFGLGTLFYLAQSSGSVGKALLILSAMLFSVGFNIGWGSMPSILMSELLPLQTRGLLAGMVAVTDWGFGALMAGAYNGFSELVHPYGAWWTFGIINLLSCLFVALFMPETKGKKLEDIEEQLQTSYRMCMWT